MELKGDKLLEHTRFHSCCIIWGKSLVFKKWGKNLKDESVLLWAAEN